MFKFCLYIIAIILIFAIFLYLYFREDKNGIIVLSEVDFIKPLSDNKKYRVIRLKNAIDVLLISDPNSSNSAASLSVGVGSTFDPNEALGLAHFCEHMMFLVIFIN